MARAFDIVGFDLDGTLLDTSASLTRAVDFALAQAGRPPLHIDEVRPMIGGGAKRMLEKGLEASGGYDPEDMKRLYPQLLDFYRDNVSAGTMPYPGLLEALDALAADGVRLTIVTNKFEHLAVKLLTELELIDRFAAVIGGDTMGKGNAKPSAMPIREMIARAGGGSAVFLGDSIYDTLAAKNAGIPSIAVAFGFLMGPIEELAADAVIHLYDELIPHPCHASGARLTMRLAAAIALLVLGTGVLSLWGASAAEALLVLVIGIAIVILLWPSSEDEGAQPQPLPVEVEPQPQPSLIDAFNDPVLIVGGGRILEANPAARRLLGEHIGGEDVRVAIRHPAAAERLVAKHDPRDTRPIELVGLGGRETRWQMNVGALEDGRQLVHLVDRTAGHAAEKMRVDFVANASHELRTPLAAILGFVETLDDDSAGGDLAVRKRFLRVINDEARRMQRLVEDLMSLSRIEAEKFRVPHTAVDLSELIKEVHAVIRDGGSPRSLDVAIDLDEGLPFVAGDRAQLSQLLHNLIGNAMKYGRPDTPIHVRLGRGPGSMLRLSVEDEGEGIAPEHLPRLTERFYRVDPSRSRSQGGTGLGLAIVKHIVERHRGRLDVQSLVGRGTTVSALLPPAPLPLSSNGNAVVTEAK